MKALQVVTLTFNKDNWKITHNNNVASIFCNNIKVYDNINIADDYATEDILKSFLSMYIDLHYKNIEVQSLLDDMMKNIKETDNE